MHTANVATKLLVVVLSLLPVGAGLPVAATSRRLSERSPQVQGLGQAKAVVAPSVEAVSAPAARAAAAATGLAPAAVLPVSRATPVPALMPSTAVPVLRAVPPVGMPAPLVSAPSTPAAVSAEEAVAAVGLIRPVLAPMPAQPLAVGQVGQALSQHMPASNRAAVTQLSAGPAAVPVVPAGQPASVYSLPMGSYTQSCQACVFNHPVLNCARCEDGQRGCRNGDFSGCAGGAREVQIDLTGCSGGVVENDHGRLKCSSSTAASRGLGASVGGDGGHRMGSDLTYSQNFQDTWVVRLAALNGWVGQPGFFLDLGAFNGVYCSNSKLLEDILGWDGAFARAISVLACHQSPAVCLLRVGAFSRTLSLTKVARVCSLIMGRARSGVCVEPFPTHSYDGGLFEARRCLLVDRALTGTLDGKTVEMEGDGTHTGGCDLILI